MADILNSLQYYPWQLDVARKWLSEPARFAHAWLIQGMAGIGKTQFAKAGAAALLCDGSYDGQACGQCQSCLWVRSGNHPDLRLIRPEAIHVIEDPEYVVPSGKNPSKHIRVEQLRELSSWFTTATHRGGYRVAVIYPAEQLNPISANALLKILEEPPGQTVFLLVTENSDDLLPTIVSRCRRLVMQAPSTDQSVRWLQQQGVQQPNEWLAAVAGAPVAAWNTSQQQPAPYPAWLHDLCQHLLSRSPKAVLQLAPSLEAQAQGEWIDVLQRFYVDLQLKAQGLPPRYYPGLDSMLGDLTQRVPQTVIQQQWKWLIHQRQTVDHPLNIKLLVHTALERIAQIRL